MTGGEENDGFPVMPRRLRNLMAATLIGLILLAAACYEATEVILMNLPGRCKSAMHEVRRKARPGTLSVTGCVAGHAGVIVLYSTAC